MDNNNSNSGVKTERRSFLKLSAASLFGGLLAARVLTNSNVAQAQTAEAVKESDPQAQSLGYHSDAKKVDTKKWSKRAGAEGGKQFCYNCILFQAKGADPKTLKQAPCAVFGNKLVDSKGWCNSWTQNPAVKG
jgi:High potential iron-sulfur protein